MKKHVIYTVLTSGYEDILQPIVTDKRFDYILFSNDFTEESVGVWQIRPIPLAVDVSDNKRLAMRQCHTIYKKGFSKHWDCMKITVFSQNRIIILLNDEKQEKSLFHQPVSCHSNGFLIKHY